MTLRSDCRLTQRLLDRHTQCIICSTRCLPHTPGFATNGHSRERMSFYTASSRLRPGVLSFLSEARERLAVKRREFITFLGGAVTWPLAARAQQPDQVRRIGVLVAFPEDDPEIKARLAAFRQGLEKRGWSEGRNVSIDTRFAPDSNADRMQVL